MSLFDSPTDPEVAAMLAAEGVPAMSDPFIGKFFEGRDALIAQEKKQRADRLFRENLSPTAAEACALVDAIRFEEQQTLWTPAYEASLGHGEQDIYPGMMFSLARDHMQQGKLWRIVQAMPKGALLHCHLQAMFDLDGLLADALAEPATCLVVQAPLDTPDARRKGGVPTVVYRFGDQKVADAAAGKGIWDAGYDASPVPLVQAADSFPDGGREGFLEWFKSKCSITSEESLKHHDGLNDIWRKFSNMFLVLGPMIGYEPTFRKAIRRMLEQLMDDGVRWVDARSTFVQPFQREGSNTPDGNYERMLEVIQEETEHFQKTEKGQGFWGLRLIWTALRFFPMKSVVESMKECIDMKLLFPDLVAGFDLVGQEDPGRPLTDFVPLLFWFRKQCAEAGIDLPFYFHAGETLGDGSATDENLVDAILLGTRRIGHGFSLYKHPLLIDMVRDRRILIESCPVSNEVLRLCASIASHPLPALIARGVPTALSNDDPAILGHGTAGMSFDFWQALQGWDNLGLAGLGSLAENSVRWATFDDCDAKTWAKEIKDGALGDGVRAQRLRAWMTEWEQFCAWVVDEFGEDVDVEAKGEA